MLNETKHSSLVECTHLHIQPLCKLPSQRPSNEHGELYCTIYFCRMLLGPPNLPKYFVSTSEIIMLRMMCMKDCMQLHGPSLVKKVAIFNLRDLQNWIDPPSLVEWIWRRTNRTEWNRAAVCLGYGMEMQRTTNSITDIPETEVLAMLRNGRKYEGLDRFWSAPPQMFVRSAPCIERTEHCNFTIKEQTGTGSRSHVRRTMGRLLGTQEIEIRQRGGGEEGGGRYGAETWIPRRYPLNYTNLFVNVVVLVNWLCTQFVRQIFEHILAGSGSNELNIEWLEDWGRLNTHTQIRNDQFLNFPKTRWDFLLLASGKLSIQTLRRLATGCEGGGAEGVCFRWCGSRFLLPTSSFLVEIEPTRTLHRLSKKLFAKLSLPLQM